MMSTIKYKWNVDKAYEIKFVFSPWDGGFKSTIFLKLCNFFGEKVQSGC